MKEVTLTLTEGYKENWYRIYLDGKLEKSRLYFTTDSEDVKEKIKQQALEDFEEVKWTANNPSVTKVLLKEII